MFEFLKSGCNNHHYGEEKETLRTRTFPRMHGMDVGVERKVIQKCLHDGCNKTKETWKHVKFMEKDELDDLFETETNKNTVVLQPVFEGIKQEKIRAESGEEVDINFLSETDLYLKVDLE